MLGNHGRSITKAIFTPLARVLARLGVTPNMVTVAGTVATVAIGLAIVMFGDSVDGTLARMTTGVTRFGAFLDSTLDRLADGAVFGSLSAYAVFQMADSPVRTWAIIAGICSIVGAAAVPYARARAESVGVVAKLGIAERTDRLIVGMGSAILMSVGLPQWVFAVGLTWVAFASFVTVCQRIWFTARHIDEGAQ